MDNKNKTSTYFKIVQEPSDAPSEARDLVRGDTT